MMIDVRCGTVLDIPPNEHDKYDLAIPLVWWPVLSKKYNFLTLNRIYKEAVV